MIKTLKIVFSTTMIAVVLVFAPLNTPNAHANVTSEEIKAQRLVVMDELIDVLHEHVKLLQLVAIDRLEKQVALLQARVEAQNK